MTSSHADPKECLKKFVFSTDNDAYEDDERLEIVIPEVKDIFSNMCISINIEIAFHR